MVTYRRWVLLAILWCIVAPAPAMARAAAVPALDERLLDEMERRACLYFREQSDPVTGLVSDRAPNDGSRHPQVASLAATGYGLAALPIAVERGWMDRGEADRVAQKTLRFVLRRMPSLRGWVYHFVDRSTGARVWQCEVSSIDTGLLVLGSRVSGGYFRGETARLADELTDRLDWTWLLHNAGEKPGKLLLSHGWTAEQGFLATDWDTYSEGILLYVLGLGARRAPLPSACWQAWRRTRYAYAGMECLASGPLFLHTMPLGFLDLRGCRDGLGYDYGASAAAAVAMHRRACADMARTDLSYAGGVWGLTACDGPNGYVAYGLPGPQDGTVAPYAAASALPLAPGEAMAALHRFRWLMGGRLWGRYGFSDGVNRRARWCGSDVIGIDLGMTLLAVENVRTGMIWRLLAADTVVAKGVRRAGLVRAAEVGERRLYVEPPKTTGRGAETLLDAPARMAAPRPVTTPSPRRSRAPRPRSGRGAPGL